MVTASGPPAPVRRPTLSQILAKEMFLDQETINELPTSIRVGVWHYGTHSGGWVVRHPARGLGMVCHKYNLHWLSASPCRYYGVGKRPCLSWCTVHVSMTLLSLFEICSHSRSVELKAVSLV